MQQKVCREKDGLVRQIVINMEKEAVQAVFEYRPDNVTRKKLSIVFTYASAGAVTTATSESRGLTKNGASGPEN